MSATLSKIVIENIPNIHPVPENNEKNYIIELYYDNNELTAKYFDKSKQKHHTFTAFGFGIM
jgi:hypothetical protein